MIMRRMSVFVSSVWWPRLAAWVVSALAAASAVAWGLRNGEAGAFSADIAAPTVAIAPVPDTTAVVRALGGRGGERASVGTGAVSSSVVESSRFVLRGVVRQGNAQAGANSAYHGVALLAVDGQAAKPVAVGAALADGWALESVAGRSAVLVRQGKRITLELPALPPLAGFQIEEKNSR